MGSLKPGVTAVIATLFEPPTLGPLVDAFKADGAQVIIVQGERTNVAWWHGMERAQTRYVMIANDDIEVCPRSFVPRLLAHHKRGFTHVLPTMWRGMNIVTPDGQGFTHGPGWAQPKMRYELHPMDKGHFISLDRIVPVPQIPGDLTVFYGDDWLYWWHKRLGRPVLVTDVQIKSGGDLTGPGFEGLSGFTQNHADLDEKLGEPFRQIAEREHKAATRYFTFYRDEPIPERWGWYGFSSGLLLDKPNGLSNSMKPLPKKCGIDWEAFIREIFMWDRGMIEPVRETMHRLLSYDGPLETVLDIGAHWGGLAIAAARLGAKRVIAVEGDPVNASRLRDNIAFYGLGGTIEVVEAAVAAKSGDVVTWGGMGTTGQRGYGYRQNDQVAETTVMTIGFCDLLEKCGPIDYCKIDVEGAEHTFMLDDERTMAALARIGFIDMEYHGISGGTFFDESAFDPGCEERTQRVMEKVGVPQKNWVSHGKVCVSVGA